MGFQIGSLIETSLTDGTSVGGFFKVKNLVNCQSPVLTKTFSTIVTFEWFFF